MPNFEKSSQGTPEEVAEGEKQMDLTQRAGSELREIQFTSLTDEQKELLKDSTLRNVLSDGLHYIGMVKGHELDMMLDEKKDEWIVTVDGVRVNDETGRELVSRYQKLALVVGGPRNDEINYKRLQLALNELLE